MEKEIAFNIGGGRFRSVVAGYHPGMTWLNNSQILSSMAVSNSARAGNLCDGLMKFIIYTEIPDE